MILSFLSQMDLHLALSFIAFDVVFIPSPEVRFPSLSSLYTHSSTDRSKAISDQEMVGAQI